MHGTSVHLPWRKRTNGAGSRRFFIVGFIGRLLRKTDLTLAAKAPPCHTPPLVPSPGMG